MTAPHAVLKKFRPPGKAKRPGLAAVEISDLSSNGKKTVAKRFGGGRITGLALIAVLTLGARLPPLRRQFYGRLRAVGRACRPVDAQELQLHD